MCPSPSPLLPISHLGSPRGTTVTLLPLRKYESGLKHFLCCVLCPDSTSVARPPAGGDWHSLAPIGCTEESGGNQAGGCCLIPPTMKGGLCGFVYSALILRKERGVGVGGAVNILTHNLSLRCELAGAGVVVSLRDPLNQPLVDEALFFSHQRPSEARMCYTQQPHAGCSSVLTGLCVGASSNDSFVILLPGFFWGAIQA